MRPEGLHGGPGTVKGPNVAARLALAGSACGRSRSAASRLGLTEGPWRCVRALALRLFPHRETLPEVWSELYRRAWVNPILENNATHDNVNAY